MSLILIVSILIHLVAIVWSIVLLRQLRDWRMGFLTIMLGLMALRQILSIWNTHESWAILITWQATEFPGLIVSILAFMATFFLKQMLTERKQVEEALCKIYEIPTALIMIINKDNRIVRVSAGWEMMFGYTTEEFEGALFTEFVHSDDLATTMSNAKKVQSGSAISGFENRYRCKDGSYKILSWFSSVDKATGLRYGCAQDITDRKQADEMHTYQASHDPLTGLVNRREFERRAERLLSTVKQHKDEHALCFMDLDQFKVVNDSCGHIAGDEMLRQLTSALQNVVRKRDTLARLGGDEFGVLMEYCKPDHAYRVASSLQKAIQDYQFSWEGRSFKVGVSIGLVSITEHTSNLTKLLKDADAACYMAKELGRNRIHVYHEEDAEMARRHGEMQWVSRLHQALEEDRFCFYAQPIVQLDGSTDTHYELLLRMIDEKGKIIPPGAFLPAAERYNLIEQLDAWVIENAFNLLANNPAFQKQINFCSINLSGPSLTDPEILEFITTKLDESGIQGNKICFEITETAAISNLNAARNFISTLKRLGCRFALDDFGSGLSSFAYLKTLPVDYLKIDGMFVRDIVDDPIDRAMVRSINEIGQVMGMQTIAEFAENDMIKGMLKEIGVNYAQGYGIGKPYPFDELLDRSSNVTDIKIPKG